MCSRTPDLLLILGNNSGTVYIEYILSTYNDYIILSTYNEYIILRTYNEYIILSTYIILILSTISLLVFSYYLVIDVLLDSI